MRQYVDARRVYDVMIGNLDRRISFRIHIEEALRRAREGRKRRDALLHIKNQMRGENALKLFSESGQ